MHSNIDYRTIIAKYPDNASWKVSAHYGQRVEAIKEIRRLEGVSLKEAKDIEEVYMELRKYGELPRYAPMDESSTNYIVNLHGGVHLKVSTNQYGRFSVERVVLIADDLTQGELLQLIARLAVQ